MRITLFLLAYIAMALPKGKAARSKKDDPSDTCQFGTPECYQWGLEKQTSARCVPTGKADSNCVDLCGDKKSCMCCSERCEQHENCMNHFDGYGKCYRTKQDGKECIQSQNLCPNPVLPNGQPCYCCDEKVTQPCSDIGCTKKVKGGKCYPSKQDGMTCFKSDELCEGMSPNSDCYCCTKDIDANDECQFTTVDCYEAGIEAGIKARCVPSAVAGPNCRDLCGDRERCMCCPERCEQHENCKNHFDGYGKCYRTKQVGKECIQSQNLCPNAPQPCYCCDEKVTTPPCSDIGCTNKVKGGKCYPSKQDGMTCFKSDELCEGMSPNSDCYCCTKDIDANDECQFTTVDCYEAGIQAGIKARCVPSAVAGPNCANLCGDRERCMCCPEMSECDQHVNCKNHFDGHGKCYRTQQDGKECVQSQNLCPNAPEPCYCCDETPPPCKSLGCSDKVKGGKCYPSKQDGMTCVKSDELCKGTSPNSDCYCCSEVADRPCQDFGCRDFFNGQGICSTRVTEGSICAESDDLCCERKVITDVTCKFTVDNEVLAVEYNGNPLTWEGESNNWTVENTLSFTTTSNGYGELKIKGKDYNGYNHCVWGGLLLKCEAADTNSPWHNFVSDTDNWRAEDGSAICTNNLGMAATSNALIEEFLAGGAKKIWTANKEVTLIGGPSPCRCCMT